MSADAHSGKARSRAARRGALAAICEKPPGQTAGLARLPEGDQLVGEVDEPVVAGCARRKDPGMAGGVVEDDARLPLLLPAPDCGSHVARQPSGSARPPALATQAALSPRSDRTLRRS